MNTINYNMNREKDTVAAVSFFHACIRRAYVSKAQTNG
nr:MAG TPA: hypothetical protein [Caudoviricetes sp.]